MIKKLIGAAAALVIAITSIGTMKATANANTDRESPIIYRISHEKENIGRTHDFTYSLIARKNGNIHVDIQCNGYTNPNNSCSINEIGSMSFNDAMIASVSEKGAAGYSSFCDSMSNRLSNGYAKSIVSYSDTQIIYTCYYQDYGSHVGEKLMYFDLYVKEDYLNINQTINFFGEEVCIPFGEELVADDTDSLKARIAELEAENASLKAEVEAANECLENFLILIDQTTNGDVNGDGYTNAVDASVILGYYAYLSTGGTITLRNYMLEEGII